MAWALLACEVEKGIRPSTIGRRVAAIRYAHKLAGHAVADLRIDDAPGAIPGSGLVDSVSEIPIAG